MWQSRIMNIKECGQPNPAANAMYTAFIYTPLGRLSINILEV